MTYRRCTRKLQQSCLPKTYRCSRHRLLPMLLAYWGYVLMCLHAGTHLAVPLGNLGQKNRKASEILYGILGCISIYGGVAFVRRGFLGYMSGRTVFAFFDYGEPIALFLLDYLTIMALFMITGYLIIYVLGRVSTKNNAVKK